MSSSSSFSSSSIPTVTDPRHELFIAKHAYLNPHIKPDRRRSTKHNPGPKLYLGYELENLEEAYAELKEKGAFQDDYTPIGTPSVVTATDDNTTTDDNYTVNTEDNDGSSSLYDPPQNGFLKNNKATEEAQQIALAIGIPVDDSAHLPPLLAGSNIGSGAYHSLQLSNHSYPVVNSSSSTFPHTKSTLQTTTLKEYKIKSDRIIREFFITVNYDEAVEAIEELSQGSKFYGYIFVSRLLYAACSATDTEREYTSRLLSTLYGIEFSMEQIGKGFFRFLEYLSDYEKDVPNINTYATKFIARAITDEILPPAFLYDPLLGSIVGNDLLIQTRTYLTLDHAAERLEHIWMINGAFSVPELKKSIQNTVQEYFSNQDTIEYGRCIRELSVPYFHHEIIYRTIVIGLDKIHKEENSNVILSHITAAFKYVRDQSIVSEYQIERGIDRVKERCGDLLLDSPRALTHLSFLLDLMIQQNIFSNPNTYSNYFRDASLSTTNKSSDGSSHGSNVK